MRTGKMRSVFQWHLISHATSHEPRKVISSLVGYRSVQNKCCKMVPKVAPPTRHPPSLLWHFWLSMLPYAGLHLKGRWCPPFSEGCFPPPQTPKHFLSQLLLGESFLFLPKGKGQHGYMSFGGVGLMVIGTKLIIVLEIELSLNMVPMELVSG